MTPTTKSSLLATTSTKITSMCEYGVDIATSSTGRRGGQEPLPGRGDFESCGSAQKVFYTGSDSEHPPAKQVNAQYLSPVAESCKPH